MNEAKKEKSVLTFINLILNIFTISNTSEFTSINIYMHLYQSDIQINQNNPTK
jgi:hypothetical protein